MDQSTEKLLRIKAAKGWRPEPGDAITGEIVRVIARQTVVEGEVKTYPMLIIDAGEPQYIAVHAFHGVLYEQLYAAKVSPGDTITIMYHGKKESHGKTDAKGNPREYHDYAVVVNGADTSEDYQWEDAADGAPF